MENMMKYQVAVVLLITMFISACNPTMSTPVKETSSKTSRPGMATVKSSPGSTVQKLEKEASAKLVKYQSLEDLITYAKKKARNEMWSEDRLNAHINLLPEGGWAVVEISGPTISSANTKWWEFVVKDKSGNETYRKKGRDEIPRHTTSRDGARWWNVEIVRFPEAIDGHVDLYVIDMLQTKRSSFRISNDKAN
jgi:hypothetical protein